MSDGPQNRHYVLRACNRHGKISVATLHGKSIPRALCSPATTRNRHTGNLNQIAQPHQVRQRTSQTARTANRHGITITDGTGNRFVHLTSRRFCKGNVIHNRSVLIIVQTTRSAGQISGENSKEYPDGTHTARRFVVISNDSSGDFTNTHESKGEQYPPKLSRVPLAYIRACKRAIYSAFSFAVIAAKATTPDSAFFLSLSA